MSEPKEIFVRLHRCIGCRSCELSCAVEHSRSKTLASAIAEHPAPKRRLYVEWVGPDVSVPVLCRHCEDAPCMHACAIGAISRSAAGVVLINDERCIGCWACVMVCPYGVIGRHVTTRKPYHCDRCPDRLSPACVDACPTRALVYRSVDAFADEVRRVVSPAALTEEEG